MTEIAFIKFCGHLPYHLSSLELATTYPYNKRTKSPRPTYIIHFLTLLLADALLNLYFTQAFQCGIIVALLGPGALCLKCLCI